MFPNVIEGLLFLLFDFLQYRCGVWIFSNCQVFFFFENSILIHILDSHACNILFVFTTFVLWEAHFDFDLIRVLLDQFCKIYIFSYLPFIWSSILS